MIYGLLNFYDEFCEAVICTGSVSIFIELGFWDSTKIIKSNFKKIKMNEIVSDDGQKWRWPIWMVGAKKSDKNCDSNKDKHEEKKA